MKLIRPNQVSGMNIHYKFYSLEYFLESQMRAGFKTIELWAGSPHFFLSNLEYDDCKKVTRRYCGVVFFKGSHCVSSPIHSQPTSLPKSQV